MSREVKRAYDGSGRRARAEQTRAEVVEAARRLFVDRGFAATTIADIAAAAHVSAETIYKSFGSKAAVMTAVARAVIRGDAGSVPLRERPAIARIRAEPDARRQLRLYGRLLSEVQPRLTPIMAVIREAARSEPEIEAALHELESDRLDGMREFAALLAGRGALRPRISVAAAADILWTLNSPELYELLVMRRGWSPARYGRWVADQLTAALLDEPSG